MSNARWIALEHDQSLCLTPEEIAEGWHFCVEWDGLLVGPGMVEQEVCSCELP